MKKYKKLITFGCVLLAVAVTLLGGGKLLVYLMLLVTGFVGGSFFQKLILLYKDYRLGLRINALQYSAKQYEAMQIQTKQLTDDLTRANEQLKLHRSINNRGGLQNYDHFTDNGLARIREDAETI